MLFHRILPVNDCTDLGFRKVDFQFDKTVEINDEITPYSVAGIYSLKNEIFCPSSIFDPSMVIICSSIIYGTLVQAHLRLLHLGRFN